MTRRNLSLAQGALFLLLQLLCFMTPSLEAFNTKCEDIYKTHALQLSFIYAAEFRLRCGDFCKKQEKWGIALVKSLEKMNFRARRYGLRSYSVREERPCHNLVLSWSPAEQATEKLKIASKNRKEISTASSGPLLKTVIIDTILRTWPKRTKKKKTPVVSVIVLVAGLLSIRGENEAPGQHNPLRKGRATCDADHPTMSQVEAYLSSKMIHLFVVAPQESADFWRYELERLKGPATLVEATGMSPNHDELVSALLSKLDEHICALKVNSDTDNSAEDYNSEADSAEDNNSEDDNSAENNSEADNSERSNDMEKPGRRSEDDDDKKKKKKSDGKGGGKKNKKKGKALTDDAESDDIYSDNGKKSAKSSAAAATLKRQQHLLATLCGAAAVTAAIILTLTFTTGL